jgi:hypothetical protein
MSKQLLTKEFIIEFENLMDRLPENKRCNALERIRKKYCMNTRIRVYNKWIEHVGNVRKENPKLKSKEIYILAKNSYT